MIQKDRLEASQKGNPPTTGAGLEALRSRFARIPIMQTLGLSLESVNPGIAIMRMPYRRDFDGVFESLHGGILMTLADTVACAAIMTLSGTEGSITTTDMNIRFLSACRTDCLAEATVIKFGRSLVPVEIKMRDVHEALVAIAQVTYMRLSLK